MIPRARAYFFSDGRRSVQTVLGLIWVLVGALQFQSFMYGKGLTELLQGLTAGQPGWVASSVNQGAATMESHQVIFNTGAALIQVAIGLGILLQAHHEAGDPRVVRMGSGRVVVRRGVRDDVHGDDAYGRRPDG